MSYNDAGTLQRIHGELNADKYKLLLEEWLPHARIIFRDGIAQFQWDNHPAHNTESVKDWFTRRHDIEVME